MTVLSRVNDGAQSPCVCQGPSWAKGLVQGQQVPYNSEGTVRCGAGPVRLGVGLAIFTGGAVVTVLGCVVLASLPVMEEDVHYSWPSNQPKAQSWAPKGDSV